MSDARDPAREPRSGDTWDSPNRLIRIVVTNGRLRGFVSYRRRFAGDPWRRYTCPPDKWRERVGGMDYRGKS